MLALIFGGIASAQLFHAKTYANIITVQESEFEKDMPETTSVTNIALMDTASARTIGNRTLGSLSQVVSQYYVNDQYSQINYKNLPKKVAVLEYAGFFKWVENRSNGIPGYVMVDPVNNSANYVEFSKPVKYAESGRLGDDLMRKLRFSYPTKIFGNAYFEIDDAGAVAEDLAPVLFDDRGIAVDAVAFSLDEDRHLALGGAGLPARPLPSLLQPRRIGREAVEHKPDEGGKRTLARLVRALDHVEFVSELDLEIVKQTEVFDLNFQYQHGLTSLPSSPDNPLTARSTALFCSSVRGSSAR